MITQTELHVYSLQPFAPNPVAVYPLDIAARLAGVPRHLVLVCCKHGLIEPQLDPDYGGYLFDAAAIHRLKRIEYLRSECGINFVGIEIILRLVDEVERLNDHRAVRLGESRYSL